ncbi:MAG: AAA family ATPase [Granulosicoccus sp.]
MINNKHFVMKQPVLYIFAGLPGTGKTTLAKKLSAEKGAIYLRIDLIEQAMRDWCSMDVEEAGYLMAYRLAADNLAVGLSVVADSCNSVEISRYQWLDVAQRQRSSAVNIEIVCSNKAEHRQRVDARVSDIPGLEVPVWDNVVGRVYEPWTFPRTTLDTSGKSVDESFAELLSLLSE